MILIRIKTLNISAKSDLVKLIHTIDIENVGKNIHSRPFSQSDRGIISFVSSFKESRT